jgi:hypothetical protein
MRIEVTQEDIDRGIPFSHTSCPIACAVQRTFGQPCWVYTHRMAVFTGLPDVSRYALSGECVDFIARFDAGKKVEPFSFTVGEEL